MYRLYNEYSALNGIGNVISDHIATLIETLQTAYPEADLNDLENVISQTAGAVMAGKRARYATNLRKNERATQSVFKANDLGA